MQRVPTVRYALAVAACELLPLPLVDTIAQNRVRRLAVRHAARVRGVELTDEEVCALADVPLDSFRRVLRGLALWPVKKIFGFLFFFVTLRRMWMSAIDTSKRLEPFAA